MKNILHHTITKIWLAAILIMSAQFLWAQPGYFGNTFIHTATSVNQTGDYTVLTHPDLDGDDSAIAIFTPNSTAGSVFNKFNSGLYYDGNNWAIYRESAGTDTIPVNSGFNVLVPSVHGVSFVHTADSSNIVSRWTKIDNAATNNNPNAIIFISHNWSANNQGVYNNHPTGVWYDGSKWAIFNENASSFPAGAAYNVFVPNAPPDNAFIHTALPGNTFNYLTNIDNPKTNNNPNAVIFVTHNYGPAGGIYDTVPVGVWYSSFDSKWSIFHESSTHIDSGTRFNVLVAEDMGSGINEVNTTGIRLSVFPNPAASQININYEIKEAGKVSLKLYSVTGQLVNNLYEGNQSSGVYTVNESIAALEPGTYFYVLNVNGYASRKPLMVVK